jgi:hypothetical protein
MEVSLEDHLLDEVAVMLQKLLCSSQSHWQTLRKKARARHCRSACPMLAYEPLCPLLVGYALAKLRANLRNKAHSEALAPWSPGADDDLLLE